MGLAARQVFTFDEYLRLEETSTVRHEFLDGLVWAMAGGSPSHSGIAVNVQALLSELLRERRCRVFNSDLRIRVKKTGLGTYPDGAVVCGALELDPEDEKGHTAINPVMLVEVLSPSTEAYDRGEKLAHYKQITALREVMLVAHDERRVDLWRRVEGGSTQLTFRAGEAVELQSLGGALAVDAIYRDPLA